MSLAPYTKTIIRSKLPTLHCRLMSVRFDASQSKETRLIIYCNGYCVNISIHPDDLLVSPADPKNASFAPSFEAAAAVRYKQLYTAIGSDLLNATYHRKGQVIPRSREREELFKWMLTSCQVELRDAVSGKDAICTCNDDDLEGHDTGSNFFIRDYKGQLVRNRMWKCPHCAYDADAPIYLADYFEPITHVFKLVQHNGWRLECLKLGVDISGKAEKPFLRFQLPGEDSYCNEYGEILEIKATSVGTIGNDARFEAGVMDAPTRKENWKLFPSDFGEEEKEWVFKDYESEEAFSREARVLWMIRKTESLQELAIPEIITYVTLWADGDKEGRCIGILMQNPELNHTLASMLAYWPEPTPEQKRLLQENKKEWFMEIVFVVSALNRGGISWGGCKAENIFVDTKGKLWVMDFTNGRMGLNPPSDGEEEDANGGHTSDVSDLPSEHIIKDREDLGELAHRMSLEKNWVRMIQVEIDDELEARAS
jgi:hypothetical protein